MTKSIKALIALLMTVSLVGCSNGTGNETATKFDKETDYLIIGAGIAGLSSAIEAADLGVENILVIDMLEVIGGAAFVSDGILNGYDTSVSKTQGLTVTAQDLYEDTMQEKNYILDSALTQLTMEKSSETIEWLINDLKIGFNPEVINKPGYGVNTSTHIVEGGGPAMRQPYMDAIAAHEGITIETSSRGVDLIVENDVVVGATVEKDGEVLRYGADAVLVATGGYASNQEIMNNVYPANKYFQTSTMPGSTGDGLLMTTKIGAGTQSLDQVQVYLRDYNNPTLQTQYMYSIFVGVDGNRFMDEKRTAQTFNQENKDDVIDLYGRTGVDYFYSINDHATMEQMGLVESAQTHEGVIIADTLEELAQLTGINEENLINTVNTWNTDVKNGLDTQYGRTPPSFPFAPISTGPYYALKTTMFNSVCHGGIMKNENAEVVRFDNSVIEGLYAAGEVTTVTNSNGFTISNAITFGRIASQNAAEYIK